MKRVVLLLLLITSAGTAQVGTWHTYTDMKLVRDLVTGTDDYWAATSGGVFHARADGTFERFTNVDGLSVIDYTAIALDDNGAVIAGSSSGMINVRTPAGEWYEVSDITRAEEIPARGITTIRVHEGKAYIGTEFGLAVYDLQRKEFGDTYQKFGSLPLRSPVNALRFDGTKLWVATGAGVAVADLTNQNLKDPASWTSWSAENSGQKFGSVRDVFIYDGHPLAVIENNSITRYNGSDWYPWVAPPTGTILKIAGHDGVLYMITDLGLYRVEPTSAVEQLGDLLNLTVYPQGTRFMDIEISGDGTIALGSTFGFTTYAPPSPWIFRKPDGPNSNLFNALAVDSDGTLWAASGITANGNGAYAFDGSVWTNHTVALDPGIHTDAITDVASEGNGRMWFTTWGNGVFLRNPDGTTEYFDGTNVPGFPGIVSNTEFSAVRSLQFDNRGNLWTLHNESNTAMLGCRTPEGQWYFFSDPSLSTGLFTMDFAVDQFDQIWTLVDNSAFRGILIFNANRTPAQTGDDRWMRLTAQDANTIDAGVNVTALAVDLLGDVWIGTDRGLRTIFNPAQPDRVSKTCFNTRCNIEGQYITSIAVDPVNNKWLGTKEGVFVLSADGSDILAHYDTDNSPLLDDEIETILVHPGNGIAYIATRRGLSSLSTAYVEPETSFTDLKVGPNPFRPGKDERVIIDGLVEASVVKILSVSGDLVAEIPTPGGRIGFWNGRTSKGDYAPSGVYFIVAAAPNGSQSAVAKVAVVRE